MALLDLIGIHKAYETRKILSNVDFSLHEGERIALIGKNGGGKSTLMKIVCGTLEADEGRRILQKNIKVGMLDQTPKFKEGMRVKEAIEEELKELKSISEGNGWTKGWSFGTGQGTSSGESKQYGGGIGGKIGAEVLGTGGDIGANIQGNYAYSNNQSQNTNESTSENTGANTSKSETTSTSGSRNVIVWPKYDENGKLEKLYLYILTGDYKNIASEFRAD